MTVRVTNIPCSDLHVTNMVDGDIAIITQWDDFQDSVGLVVQRHGNTLVVLGKDAGSSFPCVFTSPYVSIKHRVQILPVGTKFEIVA